MEMLPHIVERYENENNYVCDNCGENRAELRVTFVCPEVCEIFETREFDEDYIENHHLILCRVDCEFPKLYHDMIEAWEKAYAA